MQLGGVKGQALDELRGSAGELEPEHIAELLDDQDRRDPGGETGDHRERE